MKEGLVDIASKVINRVMVSNIHDLNAELRCICWVLLYVTVDMQRIYRKCNQI